MPSSTSTKLCTTESETIGREFIDNWSHYISLLEATEEKDITNLLALLENVRSKWQKSEAAALHYKEKNGSYEKKMKALKDENSCLNDKLLNCQSQLCHVSECKRAIENELAGYKNQWEKLRNIVKDNDEALLSDGLLAIINNVQNFNPILSSELEYRIEEAQNVEPSEIDSDKINESALDYSMKFPNVSLRRENRKRPSAAAPKSVQPSVRFDKSDDIVVIDDDSEDDFSPLKRTKKDDNTEITATITVNLSGKPRPLSTTPAVTFQTSMKRSISESTLVEKTTETTLLPPKSVTPHFNATKNNNLHTPHVYAGSWTHGQEIERRTHRVKAFNTVWEACDVCEKRFGPAAKNALKCVDCNIRFHRHCQSRAPMPCIPKVPMPKTPSKQSKCTLAQYCPETSPFIPPIIIYCIIALEKDRLQSEGIYRITANEETVKKLFKEFMSQRKIPNLAEIETENIVGCIKMFLREIKDSLIPSTAYDTFFRAIEESNEKQFKAAIFELSPPNRDTLAYFILHLQKVASHSSINKMPIENLATILAPTIIGYIDEIGTPENAYLINGNQKAILFRLLNLPTEFWNQFIENNADTVFLEPIQKVPLPSTPVLLASTPTKPSSTSKRFSRISNTTTFIESSEEIPSQKPSTNSSPLIQPLSMALKNMRRISFKSAL